jgi:hypothetical protein
MEAAARPALEPGRVGQTVLGVCVTLALALAVLDGGGSAGVPWRTGAVVLGAGLVAVGLALVGRTPVARLDRPGRVVVAAAVGLAGWTGLSIAWSIAGDRSWERLNLGLVLLSFLALGLVVGSRAGSLRPLGLLLALVLGAALVWALLGVVVPSLAPDGDRIARLREPVGYWNALALLAGAAIALGVWLATAGRRSSRGAGTALVTCAVVVVALTQSRAGVLAAGVVVALVLLRAPARLEAALLLLLGAVPGLVAAGIAFSREALVRDGAGRVAREDEAALFAVVLVAALVVASASALLLPIAALVEQHASAIRRVLAAVGVVLVLAGSAALVASVGDPLRWATDQVSGGECANDPGRLTELCDNNRLAWWGDAVEIARERPLLGSGAGTFSIARLRVRDDATPVTEPHSVPLQLLADLGLVGLALGLAVAVAALVGVRRSVRRAQGGAAWDATALVALPLAWAVHALVDYDLDFVAVSGPALLVVGALLAAGRPARVVDGGAPALIALGLAGLLVLSSLSLPALARRAVDDVYAATDLRAAADAARRARTLDPLSLDPVLAQAFVAEQAGDLERAQELLEEATRMQPDNPAPWLELGRFHFAAEPPDLCAAYQAFNEAYTLDPRSSRWVQGGPLDVARDAVNDGACEPG